MVNILVKADLDNLIPYLEEEGFKRMLGSHGRYSGCNWAFLNILDREFIYGRPGVKCSNILGEHAVTLEEFQTIWGIYKKYSGLLPLEMNGQEDK